jgi:hypothetical protein
MLCSAQAIRDTRLGAHRASKHQRVGVETLEVRRLWSALPAGGGPAEDGGAATGAAGIELSVSTPGTVGETALTEARANGSGVAVEAVAEARFRGVVARITDPAGVSNAPAGLQGHWSWRAVVDWGTGSRLVRGRVVPGDVVGEHDVIAAHTFRAAGAYAITVRVVGRPRGVEGTLSPPPVQRLSLTAPADVAEATAPLPVEYVRAGGFALTIRTITVTPRGRLTASETFREPQVERQLTAPEQERLGAAFAGWNALRPRYDKPNRFVADGYGYRLSYGDKLVQTADGEHRPRLFVDAIRVLEELAGNPNAGLPLQWP